MNSETRSSVTPSAVVKATGEEPMFNAGDRVRIAVRFPIGHYRVPRYLRGKHGWVERVIEPRGLNNEEEGFGRNAGKLRHYYRLGIPMSEIWAGYAGLPGDALRVEVFETWVESCDRAHS